MYVKFVYNDKERHGKIFEPQSPPRYGTRLPAVVLSGFLGVRISDRIFSFSDLEINDIYEDDDGVVRIVGTVDEEIWDSETIEPGNAWLCWHDGQFYLEIEEEFHPKTYKVDQISELQISRTPTQPKDGGVDAPSVSG